MDAQDIAALCAWLTTQGLKGVDELEIIDGFCGKARRAGLRLDHGVVLIDTLHPVYEGRAFIWNSERALTEVTEYGRTTEGESADDWQRSAFFHLRENNLNELRRRLAFGDPLDFMRLQEHLDNGQTDYVAMIHRFAPDSHIGDMDCLYSSWTTTHGEGFRETDLEALRQLIPVLGLVVKAGALNRISRTIAEVYLGEDAARQVLEGRMSRGKAERISAALWFSDLQNYTRISDNLPPDEIIPFLNDYADAVITSVHENGGTVLKLIGDGTLAIFKTDDREQACGRALQAERNLRERLKELNARREQTGRPMTEVYLGLHIGDVFYGNIGSDDRLDFTVIGPAVNEVSRIASMCRFVDRSVIMSSEFVAAAPPTRGLEVVSIGRYALRGVKRAQELFTLMPLPED